MQNMDRDQVSLDVDIRHSIKRNFLEIIASVLLSVAMVQVINQGQFFTIVPLSFILIALLINIIQKWEVFLKKENQQKFLQQNELNRYVANLGWHYGLKHSIGEVDARNMKYYQKVLEEFKIRELDKLDMSLQDFYDEILKEMKTFIKWSHEMFWLFISSDFKTCFRIFQ